MSRETAVSIYNPSGEIRGKWDLKDFCLQLQVSSRSYYNYALFKILILFREQHLPEKARTIIVQAKLLKSAL